MSAPTHHDGPELIPPPDPGRVLRLGVVGVGCCAIAAAVGLATKLADADQPGLLSTLRVLVSAVGVLVVGSALSMLPGAPKAWGLAAAAALLAAAVGLPSHWDSARLLAAVMTAVAAAAAVLLLLPRAVRFGVGSVLVLFHFGGILSACTMPEPGPWLSSQAFNRVYYRYLTFVYLRNAYHFYSPEPGPASLLYVLVKYETTDPETGATGHVHEWLEMPRRDVHMKDPLGLSYYRRLSITEMLTSSITAMNSPQTPEKEEAARLRQRASFGLNGQERIPLAPDTVMPFYSQYRVPYPHISRYLVPSYARHLAAELSGPDRRVVSLKIYRLEHRVLNTPAFANGADPFDPATYLPFYLGEFDATGKLVDPQDPMLYWLVPIIPKPGGAAPTDPDRKAYDDYLSKHAGFEVDWRRR